MPATPARASGARAAGYRPKVTYLFTVDGVDYTSDNTLTRIAACAVLAEQALAAIRDDVDVHYDPGSRTGLPREALAPHGLLVDRRRHLRAWLLALLLASI